LVSLFDYVIKNGTILDPSIDMSERHCWIGIEGPLITKISDSPLEGRHTVDASDCYVTPGLIDFHTHLFHLGSEFGLKPDFLLSQGVTSAVDAGTSGSAGFESFYHSSILPASVDVRAFVSLGATGLSDPKHHQRYDKEKVNIKKLERLKRLYGETILGLKVSMSKRDVDELGIEPLKTAIEVAEEIGDMRVCVHSTDPPCDSKDLLALLRPGDIFCHCFHGTGSCILDREGHIREEYREARRKGVIFDAANGISHTSHTCVSTAIKEDFLPDIISSDMVSFAYGVSPRNKSLPYVMSKYLAFGMPLLQIIKAVTLSPAMLMGMSEKIGTLRPGAFADIAILKEEHVPVQFEDAAGDLFCGQTLLCPQMTMKKGQVAFFQNTFNI